MPHPGVIDLRVAEFSEAGVSAPGVLVLVHPEQSQLDARVIVAGDEALNLHALAGKRVLVVAINIVRGDAAGRRDGGG